MNVLISAYACAPNEGSEPELGWSWAQSLQKKGYCVTVLTRSNNKDSLFEVLDESENPISYIFFDLPPVFTRLKKIKGLIYLYYILWQWFSYKKVSRLGQRFDYIHHVTFASLKMPSFLGLLDGSFIFGPAGGGEETPRALRTGTSKINWFKDLIRSASNRLNVCNPLMRFTFRTADKIYVTSSQSLDLVPRRYHHKCTVRLAISISGEICDTHRRMIGSQPKILFVGRLLYWKGWYLTLLAFKQYRSYSNEASLTIIGNGPDRVELSRAIRELELTSAVTVIPYVENNNMTAVYDSHDILLFPSYHDSGGYVVLEAIQHGLPVIVLDVGGPGVMVNNEIGYKVDVPPNKTLLQIANDLAVSCVTAEERLKNCGFYSSKTSKAVFNIESLVNDVYG